MKETGEGFWYAGQGDKSWQEQLPAARSFGLPPEFDPESNAQPPTILDQFGKPFEPGGEPAPDQPE